MSDNVARSSIGALLDWKDTPTIRRMFKVQRLSQYEKYFQDLLKETRAEHPDHDDIARQAQKAKQLVRRAEGGPETDLDRIQDLFPQDSLYLHEKDPSNMKVKGLMRKRSVGVGAAARLQRALSTKALPGTVNASPASTSVYGTLQSSTSPMHAGNVGPGATLGSQQGQPHIQVQLSIKETSRMFVMESAVQFTTGVQSQDRHLFLFNDLLLVAKSRSGGNFKLKERVLICEMWLASTNDAIDEVTELTRSRDTSFVVGWPTTNVVATFNTAATKDLWFNKLQEVIAAGKEREPSATTIQITYYDALNRIEYCKTLQVAPTDTARDCVRAALEHLEMGTIDASHFQLWVRTGHDDSPYPLIGHEYPFAIKMNCLRDYLATCDNENVDLNAVSNMMDSSCTSYYCESTPRCTFILRNLRKESLYSVESKKAKKSLNQTSKSPIRIHKMFRRSLTKLDSTDGASPTSAMTTFPGGLLFGQPLAKLCETETVPRPVMEMLLQLFLKGPFTHGIFRKSANARQVRELREQLDTNPDGIDWDQVPIFAVAALLKDFLRSLPDCLLGSTLFHDWLAVSQVANPKDKMAHIQGLFSKLPKENVILLQHFLCVLHHIARRLASNQMSASNLAVCVGPSLLWPANAVANGSPIAGSGNAVAAALAMGPETSRLVPSLVELMIDRCAELFGHETLQLFGEAPPNSSSSRQDSGAEESDSLHSGQGDSLERDMLGEEPSPLPRKDKMSLTNLSRDSGLTMSDTQLYTPDEEENESTSSGHSGGDKSTYSSGHGSEKSGSEPIRYHHPPGNPSALYASVTRKTPRPQQLALAEASSVPAGPGDLYPPHLNVHHHKLTVSYSNPNCDTPTNTGAAGVAGSTAGYGIYEEIGANSKSSAYNNPYFQRTDWTRKHAGLRKVGRTEQQLLGPNRHSPLRRSASEESLMDKVSPDSRSESPNKRPAQHRKGRAPMPPQVSKDGSETSQESGKPGVARFSPHIALQHRIVIENTSTPATMHRSRSAHHLGVDEEIETSRTSARRQQLADSCDSSTLSDDDSTPHVSRSNSRGKDFNSTQTLPNVHHPHNYEAIYGSAAASGNPSSRATRHSSASSTGKPEININRTGSTSTVKSTDSSSTLTNGSVCSSSSTVRDSGTTARPPSYEETLNRRSSKMNSPARSSLVGSPSGSCDQLMRGQSQQSKRSSKAEQLYQESLRIQHELEGQHPEFIYASAARVETHEEAMAAALASGMPPPLPPKQKVQRATRPISYGGPVENEPIYAPVPLTRRKAHQTPASVPPSGASSSPSRAMMAKRHSVETQTETAAAKVPLSASYGGSNRRHSAEPSSRGFPSGGQQSSKTQEKYVSSVRIGDSPTSSMTLDFKKRRSSAVIPGGAQPIEETPGLRGRLKRKEAAVGTSSPSLPSSASSSPGGGPIGSGYSPRKSAGGVRAALNHRAAAAAAAAAAQAGTNPAARSKSLPPSEERQTNTSSRVSYYRDSSDTELGDTSTSEIDENRSWTDESASSDFVDPSLRKEISWSVSQLRALFGGGGGGANSPVPQQGEWRGPRPTSGSTVPPPYRHPPTGSQNYFGNKGAHKTASSDSGWSTSSPHHTRSDSPSSSSNGEESYV